MTLRPTTAALVVALAASAVIADPPEYVIREYGRPSSIWPGFRPMQVNAEGVVCGFAYGSAGASAPYTWHNGEFTSLEFPPQFDTAVCTDINTAGEVVGMVSGPGILSIPVLWSKVGFVALPLPDGATWGRSEGINDAGLIVGWCEVAGTYVACQWEQGVVSILPSPGYVNSKAMGVSNDGRIVGIVADSVNDHQTAIRWIDGQPDLMGSPEAGQVLLLIAADDHGRIVSSWAVPPHGQPRPYQWSSGVYSPMDLPAEYGDAYCRASVGPTLSVGDARASGGWLGVVWSDGFLMDMNGLLLNGTGWFVTGLLDVAGPGYMVADTDNDGDGGREYAFIEPVGAGFNLVVDTLIAGQLGTFSVTGGNPNTRTYLAYSLRGRGNTFIAPLNVSLDLDTPIQAGNAKNTDATGAVEWNLPIPANSRGRDVWFQAVQYGIKTNVFATWVN